MVEKPAACAGPRYAQNAPASNAERPIINTKRHLFCQIRTAAAAKIENILSMVVFLSFSMDARVRGKSIQVFLKIENTFL
jgi:hypothetical protein